MKRQAMLLCGVFSPLLYAVADVVAGLSRPDYSFRDHVISELSAVGAPSRALFSAILVGVYLLFIVFGVGVWQVAGD